MSAPRSRSPLSRLLLLGGLLGLARFLGLRSRLLHSRALLGGPGGAAICEELDRSLVGDLVDGVTCAQGRVGVAVRHVRAEPAVLQHDRLSRRGIFAELL